MTGLGDTLARIPYLRPHRLKVTEGVDGEVTVRMPLSPDISNHVGIVHAGALFTAGETAAGVVAWRVVPDDRALVLLRDATVRYTRRTEGDVAARANVDREAARAAREAFEESGRADVTVDVVARDSAGDAVFEGHFGYALRPRTANHG